jgi:hypothetical protein
VQGYFPVHLIDSHQHLTVHQQLSKPLVANCKIFRARWGNPLGVSNGGMLVVM